VTIDTTMKLTDTNVEKPFGTRAQGSDTTKVNASKKAWATTVRGTIAGILGVPTVGGAFTGTQTSEASSSTEVKKFNSRIIQYDSCGVVWWGFLIDNPYERE
jgi:hypothetical protein